MTLGCRSATKAALSVVLMAALVTLVPTPVVGTTGTLTINVDTTLTEDHFGNIVFGANDVTLDCAGFNVTSSGGTAVIRIDRKTGITVKNCRVSGSFVGIWLVNNFNTGGNLLVNNTAEGNQEGFVLGPSFSTTLTGNTAINNTNWGFSLFGGSFGNTLEENLAQDHFRHTFGRSTGFRISDANNNIFTNNTVISNSHGFRFSGAANNNILLNNTVFGSSDVGFWIGEGSGNRIFHNNILSNTLQARDYSGGNFWDDAYPSGGNFWSDYTGEDSCSGPDQDICTDPDGIGDTPYVLDADSQDRYPLMVPLAPLPPLPPIASFTVSPAEGNVTTTFMVDASASSDFDGVDADLEVRWDWEDDGVWDTLRSTAKTAEHQYPSPGSYAIRLEVLDGDSLTDETTRQVLVDVTTGTLTITTDTTLTKDHLGNVVIAADDVILDCAGYNVTSLSSGVGLGISLRGIIGATVKNCQVTDFYYGFFVGIDTSIPRGSSGNTLTNNTAINNAIRGFALQASDNAITNNTAINNGGGFVITTSSGNTFTGNVAINSTSSCTLGQCGGFELYLSAGNLYDGNTASDGQNGFYVYGSSNNVFTNNTVTRNQNGFNLTESSGGNIVFHNRIINNTIQASDATPSKNDWHHFVLEEGNFWSDYAGVDDGSGTGKHAIACDGIGDTLIPHPGPGFDSFPLVASTDNTPPTTSATHSGTAGMAGWFTSPVDVALSATDDACGIASTSYRIDGGGWQESTSFMVEGDGVHTIDYFSTDGAGNAETVRSFDVKIDATASETSFGVDGIAGESGWFTSPVTATLTAFDATSGVAAVTYRIGGAWQEYTGPFPVEGDGLHTVEYYSTDVAGNEEVVNSFDVEIDTSSPSLSITSPVAGESFATGDIEVTWEAGDPTSGIDRFEVSMDGETVILPAITTSHTFTEVADGAHTVTVIAFDVAGNSVVLSVELTVDTVDTDISTGPDVGLLVGIAVGMATGAVAVTALLIRRRRAKGKTQR